MLDLSDKLNLSAPVGCSPDIRYYINDLMEENEKSVTLL